MTFSLEQLREQFRSLRRFPVPVACVLVLAALVNFDIAFITSLTPLEYESTYALIAAVLAALIVDLIAEARRLTSLTRFLIGIVFAVAIAALQLSHGKLYDQSLVVIGALMLGLMAAPYLRSDATNESLWKFDLGLGLAAAMGLVALLVSAGGLSLLLGSIHYLFEVDFPEHLTGHIWATGATLIAMLFALATIPAQLDERFMPSDSPAMLERAVGAMLNFALAPLVLAYALMLHVYAAKIAITATMPRGEIGWLVLSFGAIGTLAYMIAYPWRERGSRAVRWFGAGWFWMMMAPTLMLLLAAWQRIGEHGITPDRYALCLFAMWMVAMAAYFGVLARRIDLRAIPISLSLGLLLSSFGPWGAVSASTRSQLHQLYATLNDRGLLAGDQLKLSPPTLATFTKLSSTDHQLQSILNALYELDALPRVAPLFASITDNPFKRRSLTDWDLHQALALSAQAPALAPTAVIPVEVDLSHYDRMVGPLWIEKYGVSWDGPYATKSPNVKLGQAPVTFADQVLTVSDHGTDVTFDLAPALTSAAKAPYSEQALQIAAREGSERGTILAEPMWSGAMLKAWLLLGRKSIH